MPPMTSAQGHADLDLSNEALQLSLLVHSVTDYAIYMLDGQGYVRSWNAGGQRIKGYRPDEIVGRHFSQFYLPEDIEKGMPALGLRTARDAGKYEAEGWRLRKDGTRFRASVVIDPIWHNQRLIGFAKVTRDITERFEADQRLQEAQRALAQSQKIEAIGKLTFGLAHDFNNLLTVVVNSLDLIGARTRGDARTTELVEAALQAADHGGLLTRQLLGFARGQKLVAQRHDINGLVMRSMELYRRTCGAAVQIATRFGTGLPPVLVDAAQFEACLMNLVANSRDAMPKGGTVTFSTQLAARTPPEDPDGMRRDFVCIEVADTGTGMPQGILDRAMEPFFTTKEIGKGSGLGLSQVIGFAAQSGGFATIRSTDGLGTSVQICLPPAGD